jgi:hypothetical protein
VRLLAGDELGHHHALVLGLVREHRAAHHVADRDTFGRLVRQWPSTSMKPRASTLRPTLGGARARPCSARAPRDDEPVALELLRRALVVGVLDHDARFFAVTLSIFTPR